jgi:hypothetical protein
MLSPLDDYPIHQVAEVMRHVGTSDRNFYDRYYFNAHPCAGDLFLITGMGQYPNLGVADAFAVVRRGPLHQVVRASRELGADRMDTSVGPFHIEVLEGLKRLRVALEPNEWGLDFDLTWEGTIPATREPRHFIRQRERVVFDSVRMAQTGGWSGRLRAGDESFDVTPDRWWGARDRSWGVRPVGEPEPPGIRAADRPSFFWIYAPMQFPDFSILTIVQEDPTGARLVEEAVRVFPTASGRKSEYLGRPEHRLEYEPGTRNVRAATLGFSPPGGSPFEVRVESVLPLHIGVGTGYGFDPDWRHGMYQGPLKVEGLTLDLRRDEDRKRMFGLVDHLARFECDGQVGWGLFEVLVFGPHEPSGFAD